MEWRLFFINRINKMKRIFISIYLWIACIAVLFAQSSYKLVWSDEFNQDGLLDT